MAILYPSLNDECINFCKTIIIHVIRELVIRMLSENVFIMPRILSIMEKYDNGFSFSFFFSSRN